MQNSLITNYYLIRQLIRYSIHYMYKGNLANHHRTSMGEKPAALN